MKPAVTLIALVLWALPLPAQTTWDPDSWTAQGWRDDPLAGRPLTDVQDDDVSEDPARLELGTTMPRARPLETVEQENPLVLTRSRTEERDSVLAEVASDGAVLRGLDRVTGEITDLTLAPGQTGQIGQLDVTLQECRYPADNPASDAFAYLDIVEPRFASWLFSGWMLASSPALNPLDHRRYDVWVLRCSMS